jgi:hypothetical protein
MARERGVKGRGDKTGNQHSALSDQLMQKQLRGCFLVEAPGFHPGGARLFKPCVEVAQFLTCALALASSLVARR